MLDLPAHELHQQQAHVIRQQRRLEDEAWLALLRSTKQHNETIATQANPKEPPHEMPV